MDLPSAKAIPGSVSAVHGRIHAAQSAVNNARQAIAALQAGDFLVEIALTDLLTDDVPCQVGAHFRRIPGSVRL
jgi:hypothetical protein